VTFQKTIQLREVMQKMREVGLNPMLGGGENDVEDEQHDEAVHRREEQEGGASPSSSTLLLLNTAPHPLAHNSSRINHGCNGSTTLISSSDERGGLSMNTAGHGGGGVDHEQLGHVASSSSTSPASGQALLVRQRGGWPLWNDPKQDSTML